MKEIYTVTIQGHTLESADLRKLLSRAVREKRDRDRMHHYAAVAAPPKARARVVPLLAVEAR
jgi:hypothetical protein